MQISSKNSQPRVSLGLPVYNGENYLAEALDSLLNQTFTDFELIICDNASTDRTETICRHYSESDKRICYHQNQVNVGAAGNFNKAFKLAKGEYFKWASHDDLCDKTFLAECVATLDENQDAVLAYPKAQIIDNKSELQEIYKVKLPTDDDRVSRRYLALLKGHRCFEIFGLIRRDILAKTPLMGAYSHGDGVLLARLALYGKFIEIPKVLFFSRRHEAQSMNMLGDYQTYAAWFDSKLRGRMVFPHWRIYFEFFRSLYMVSMSWTERQACHKHLARKILNRRRFLIADLKFQLKKFRGQIKRA